MENILEYSFDDEFISEFCYDIKGRSLSVAFEGHYRLSDNNYIDGKCVWRISNWEKATSKLHTATEFNDIDDNIGVFSMIVRSSYNGEKLEITVNTLDNRYVDFDFVCPELRLDSL